MNTELKEKVIGFFRNDWPLKLTSVLLAIVIWFMICEYVDPDTDTPVNNISIAVNYENSVPQKEGLGIMTVIDETVSVRVGGSRDTIALMDPDKITASLDMSNVTRSGEYDLPVKIDLGGQNITLVEQSIKTLKVKFDKNIVSNVKINVNVKGDVPEGLIMEEPSLLNGYVTVTGPQAIVETITAAEVEIKQERFMETSTFNCAYKFIDAKKKEVPKTFLTTDIETVDVTIGVVKLKTVPFTVGIINSSGGNDSAFCKATIEPKDIKISGGAEALDAINAIDLGMIDVAEHTKDFETSLAVVLPNGVKNVDNIENVKVSVKFTDVQQQTFEISNIQFQNLPSGIDAKVQERRVRVRVRGIPADIKTLNAKDIKLIVDVKDQVLTAGTHHISALIDFPDNLNVGAVGKYQMTVVVS